MRVSVTAFLLTGLMVHGFAGNLKAQRVTIDKTDASFTEVIRELRRQSGYAFLFSKEVAERARPVSIQATDAPLQEVLEKLAAGQGLSFIIKDDIKSVVLREHLASIPSPPTSTLIRAYPEVHGTVTDSLGQPLAGASVRVLNAEGKRTTLQTTTDSHGEFVLRNVPDDALLEISFIGFVSQTVKAASSLGTLVLRLAPSALDEVVINKGYYTTTQQLNTGSVSSVGAEVLGRQPVSDPLLALSGRIPGLYISQTTGVPGSEVRFSLRGRNSIANGNNPLFVIDGVPYLSEYPTGATSIPLGAGRISPFANIPIHMIESIDVLKDADATAIYGSRGANGVILITTKRSHSEKTAVTVDFSSGAGAISMRPQFLNTAEYLKLREQAFENDGATYGATDYDVNGAWDQSRYTDWTDLMIGGTAKLNNATIGIRGGNQRTQFSLSGSYRDETTVFPGENNNRKYGTHISVSHRSQDDKFDVSYAAFLSDMRLRLPTGNMTSYISMAPNAPSLYNEDGSLNWENSTWTNPFFFLTQTSLTSTNTLNNDLSLSYQILNNLSVSSRFGYNESDQRTKLLESMNGYNPAVSIQPTSRRHIAGEQASKSWIIEPAINYGVNFASSKLDVLLGTTFQHSQTEGLLVSASGFSSDAQIENIAAATTIRATSTGNPRYRYSAIYSRIGYSYQDKYVLNLTGRRDGSSRFGPGKQFGNFWSIGGAWLFSKESFFPQETFVNFGKLRASYGSTGNDQLGDYKYISAYTANSKSYQDIIGLSPIQHTNPEYGWEEVKKLEAALELGLFQNRIQLNINWYRNRTGNQLVGYPLPFYTGFGSVQANLPAIVQNSGTEIELQTNVLDKKNFKWDMDVNMSIPRNKLVSYPDIESSSYATRYQVGKPLTGSFLYHYTGLDNATKLPTFLDRNSDGLYRTADDRLFTFVGQKTYAGLNNSFTIFQDFQLDLLLQYVNQVSYEYHGATSRPGSFAGSGSNLLSHMLDDSSVFKHATRLSSTPSGQAYTLFSGSDGMVGDASFVRLKNVSISWALSQQLLKAVGLKGVKLYAQGQNLFTLTKYKGLDPEIGRGSSSAGISLPVLKMGTVGVQITL